MTPVFEHGWQFARCIVGISFLLNIAIILSILLPSVSLTLAFFLPRSSTNAADIELRGVRRELQFFIEQYRQGHRETSALVSLESLKTREHVSREAERTNAAVARVDQKVDRLVVLKGAQVDEQRRECFLRSLKYPGFNERRNQVADAYGDSLEWIFVGDNDDTSDQGLQSVEDYGPNGNSPSRGPSKAASESGSDSKGSTNSDREAGGHSNKCLSNIRWDSFSNWLSSTDAIYWISGKPGSGKTTLVKYIVGHQRTKEYLDIWSPGCKIVSHYFWRPGTPMQKTLEGLLCSLLYQLLGSSATALGAVISLVSKSGPKDSYTDWSSAELLSALLKALDSYEHGVCLFLDGLDEVDPENGTKDGIPELLDLAVKLSQMSRPIKLCLASRPDPPMLGTRLSTYPRLRLQDLNFQDLMKYARGHVNLPETYDFPKIYHSDDDPIQWLVHKAEGVFLWLILATRSVNEGVLYNDTATTLYERIDRLPKDLDNLYQDMWERAGSDNPLEYRQTAALYFKLLLAPCADLSPSSVFERMTIFHLMLATIAPIADEAFDALDESSKLVCQDSMLQKCREVEQKLNICCFGLIEVWHDNSWNEGDMTDHSWYGRKYDSVLPFQSLALRFIHRTARDFLTDTESGAKILGVNTESDFMLQYRLMKASLAALVFFAEEVSAGWWAYVMGKFRQRLEGTDEWEARGWNQLVLICEKLANSGRLMGGYDHELGHASPCVGLDFLKLAASVGIGDQIIISRLENGSLSAADKSGILLSVCGQGRQYGNTSPLRTTCIRKLLQAGADPSWQPEGTIWEGICFKPYQSLGTPWQRYMLRVIQDLSEFPTMKLEVKRQTLASMIEGAFLLVSEGAELGDVVNMGIRWEKGEDAHWTLQEILATCSRDPHWQPNLLLASIPAYVIVEVLAEAVRYCFPRDGEETFSEDRSCQFLETECVNHCSTQVSRVFGMRKEGKKGWWETTDEVQTQLGSRLIEDIIRRLWLPTPVMESHSGSRARLLAQKEISQSILKDESWTLKVDVGAAVRKPLMERGLIKQTNQGEKRTIKEWVNKYNRESRSGTTV